MTITELLSALFHGASQVFGACAAAYWVIRLAIRHEMKRANEGKR